MKLLALTLTGLGAGLVFIPALGAIIWRFA